MAFIYALLIASGLAQTSAGRPTPDPVNEFHARVEQYAQLRRLVASVSVPRLEPMSDPRTLCDARDALAIGIARARPDARMGDLLFPAVAEIFRERIRRTASPEALREWFHALYSEGQRPPQRRATVHSRVPANEFPPVTPVGLLAILPDLPPELAYRLAGRDLLLVDADVSLVIDVLPEALPSPLRP